MLGCDYIEAFDEVLARLDVWADSPGTLSAIHAGLPATLKALREKVAA